MAINYPTSLDNFTNPQPSDTLDSVAAPHATQHSDLNDAVEALQAKVGVDSSAVTSSLDYKVANHTTSIADHASRLTTLEAISHGKILQVVSTTKTDTFTTTSTSFVDVTGVSQAITPSSASNKVLVTVTGVAGNTDVNQITLLMLVRDSTNIGVSTGGAIFNSTQSIFTANVTAGVPFSISFLDSPSTTSATTYKLQAASTSPSGTGVIGRPATNANTGAITTITVMEVSA